MSQGRGARPQLTDGPLRFVIQLDSGKQITLYPHDLASPERTAAAVTRQIDVPGYECPVLSPDEHRQVVRDIFRLCELCERTVR